MNKLWNSRGLAVLVIIAVSYVFPAFADQGDDTVFRAMNDELQRSMSELKMPGFEPPYFMSYTIDDYQDLTVRSTLGTIVRSRLDRARYLTVDMHVGKYELDNSNFIAGYYGRDPNYFMVAQDNDYDAIRNQIYLATDRIYKGALKDLSKKEAYLQTRVIENRPADFLKQTANTYVGPKEAFDINEQQFKDLAGAASEVFRDYPMIMSSEVAIEAGINNQYFVNSAGSRALRGNREYTIEISMSGKSADGEDISDGAHIVVNTLGDIPSREKLVAWARENAERMKAILASQTVDEYTGPVIFEGDAAGEFFRQLFAKNISGCPAPLYENDRVAERADGPEFGNKVKRRIMPEFISIYDDPTIDKLGNMKLIGNFKVDDAGNPSQKVQLVQQGKLVSLLIGVAPTKQVTESNGHARGAVSKDVAARPGNLIIESADKTTPEKLRKAMLGYCQDMGLDYGIVIRRLDDPDSPGGGMNFFAGDDGALSAPLEAYKVYRDGREEPVRNLEFSNVTVRILKDIMQTGDKPYAYNYLIGGDYEMPATIVCPSVLVEEMELKKTEAKIKKPPILPSPLAGDSR